MIDTIQAQIETHAREAYPHECAGFIVERDGKKSVRRIDNHAPDPANSVLNDSAWMEAEDAGYEIYLSYHSECDQPDAVSKLDRDWSNDLQTPTLVFSLPRGTFTLHEPPGFCLPYEGRPFIYQATDCAKLFRDFYAHDGGVVLPDEPHEPDFWLTRDIWGLYLARHGFFEVKAQDARRGDLILFNINASVPSQCAVWLDDGRNGTLIHPQDHESAILDLYSYRGLFADRVHSFWRHPAFVSSPC